MDLILSSGFLAFAGQAGFLKAVEDAGVPVAGVCGTSSGALAGSLFAAGLSAAQVADELERDRPLALCRPHLAMWRGLFSMRGVVTRLQDLMPATFEELPLPFGVGVVAADGSHRLITSGPLPEAVAASMAIPRLFAPVDLGGELYSDGAFVDRTALNAWREHRGSDRRMLVHLVDASNSGGLEPDLQGAAVVRTQRSFAKLWSLGDYRGQLLEAYTRTQAVLAPGDP
jgi:predicted acylesterase/phospholipase RssA